MIRSRTQSALPNVGQINEPKNAGFKVAAQSTADHPDMQPKLLHFLCSPAVHVQSRKSKDPKTRIQAFFHHPELAPISVLYDIATSTTKHLPTQPTTNCTTQQQWHPIAPTLTTLQPRRLQAML
jgi:hypothetical protein